MKRKVWLIRYFNSEVLAEKVCKELERWYGSEWGFSVSFEIITRCYRVNCDQSDNTVIDLLPIFKAFANGYWQAWKTI